MDYELPYDFDLHFDIKTKVQLIEEYVRLKDRLNSMKDVCKSHNIDIEALITALGYKETKETKEDNILRIDDEELNH